MEIAHVLERGFGYLLLLFSLPMFMGLYIAFHSGLVSPFFLQGLSSTISSFTNNSLLSGLFSFSILNNLLFVSGLVAIAGGALILFGSKDYTGLSAIGTEVLIISVLSLVFAYATSSYLLPYAISHVTASASSITSIVSTIASPLISEVFVVDVVFIAFGAALIALRFLLPYLVKTISSKRAAANKNKRATVPTYSLYRYVGIPVGSAVMILILALMTIFGPSLFSGTTYQTTAIAANSVSLAYQSLAETPQILNLSDFYFLSAPNLNSTYNGQLTLSPSFEPMPFALPMQFSISKLNDPFLRVNFDINISEFSGLISAFHPSNSTQIPNNIKFTFLYNESGIITCSNLANGLSASAGLQCNYNSLPRNFSKILMNINSSNANDSIIGTLFEAFSLPAHLLSSNQNSSTPLQNYLPTFTFINHVSYNGNNCSLFDINGNYSISKTQGQICILDTDGLPAFLNINEILSTGNAGSFDIKFAFGLTALTGNVTLTGINSLPQNVTFTSSATGIFG
jgi:hypothetical protein